MQSLGNDCHIGPYHISYHYLSETAFFESNCWLNVPYAIFTLWSTDLFWLIPFCNTYVNICYGRSNNLWAMTLFFFLSQECRKKSFPSLFFSCPGTMLLSTGKRVKLATSGLSHDLSLKSLLCSSSWCKC